jgi:hypothetical protein
MRRGHFATRNKRTCPPRKRRRESRAIANFMRFGLLRARRHGNASDAMETVVWPWLASSESPATKSIPRTIRPVICSRPCRPSAHRPAAPAQGLRAGRRRPARLRRATDGEPGSRVVSPRSGVIERGSRDSPMSRRFIVAMLGLGLALFLMPQVSLAVRQAHCASTSSRRRPATAM